MCRGASFSGGSMAMSIAIPVIGEADISRAML